MDKKAFFDSVTHMEEQISDLYGQLTSLKDNLQLVLEENNRLAIENTHLREAMAEQQAAKAEQMLVSPQGNHPEVDQSAGHDNLMQLYKEGFHICNVHFGSPRINGEDCLFCLGFLNQQNNK